MQRWEYLTVQLGDFAEGYSQIVPRFVNGQELRDCKTLDKYVSQLGNDGWELTGTISASSTSEHVLFFKRMVFDIMPVMLAP